MVWTAPALMTPGRVQPGKARAFAGAEPGGFREQRVADGVAADAGPVVFGAEEFVDLLEELAAGAVVFVEDEDGGSQPGRFGGGRQAGRAGADDDDVCV